MHAGVKRSLWVRREIARRKALQKPLMLSGLSAFGAAPPNTLPSAPPNIVLAVSDDIPRNAHGAYGAARRWLYFSPAGRSSQALRQGYHQANY